MELVSKNLSPEIKKTMMQHTKLEALHFAKNLTELTTLQTPIDMEDLTILWQVLGLIYGRIFWTSYGRQPNLVWFKVLEGLTKRELQYGILSVFKFNKDYSEEFKAWPPNAKEFLMLCRYRSSDFKLLMLNEAFDAARASLNRISYIWPHITVYLAARDIGVEALVSNTNETFYDFKYHYQVYCQQFMAGIDLGTAPNQGFLYKAFSLSEHAETAKKHLAQCYKILNYRGNRC